MKTLTHISLVLALLFAGIFSTQAQMNLQYADTLSKVLKQCQQDENMKGLAGAVVFSDGSVWSAASGKHGFAKLKADHLYDIGSNTKTMVSTIILLLEEEGALALNDTLYKFISPIENVSYGITIEQLLNHRSGVFSITSHPDFSEAILSDEGKFWHPDSVLANFINEPDFAPGASWKYSNTGYILLGKVIEAIENKPFNEVLRDRIFNPMNLNDIYLDQYDDYTKTKTGSWLDANYYYKDDFVSYMSSAWAAGAVVATPEDFAMYAYSLYGGDFLSESSMQKLRTGTQLPNGSIYGLGVFERTYKGKKYLGHGGTTLQNSHMEYSLESNFSLVLMNIDDGFNAQTTRAKYKMLDLLEYIEENHVENTPTFISETANHKVEVNAFPNPSNTQMTLNVTTDGSMEMLHVALRDVNGRLVHREQAINGTVELQKSQFGAGIFIASTYNGQTLIDSKRIVFN